MIAICSCYGLQAVHSSYSPVSCESFACWTLVQVHHYLQEGKHKLTFTVTYTVTIMSQTCRQLLSIYWPTSSVCKKSHLSKWNYRMNLLKRFMIFHIVWCILCFICVQAFWRENGFSGEIVGNGGAPVIPGCDTGPIQLIYDSVTGYGNPALVGFYANAWQWRQVDVSMHA